MLRLPEYSLLERVTAETGKQDRIKIEIGEWLIRGIPNDLADFFRFLGPYPTTPEGLARVASSQTRPLTPERFGWMFNRHDGEDERITKIDLRGSGRGSGSRQGRPIAVGTLYIRQIRGNSNLVPPTAHRAPNPSNIQRRLFLDLQLNPTRFVKNQPWPVLMGEPVDTWQWPDPVMRTRNTALPPRPDDPEDEIILDGKDNVLQLRKLSLGRPAAWPEHLRRYFQAFETAINT